MMRALDLFSAAAGGWSLGLHRAGFITVAACEIIEWRRILYSENFPHVRLYEDIRDLTAARLVSDLGFLPDIVVGSPPCQDISVANTKGKGVEGERSGLYLEAIRIVGECRPRWFALENSAHLRTRGADRVLGELEALGYATEPCVVAAAHVGANHERKRSWLIGFDPEQLADTRVAIPAGWIADGGRIGSAQGDEGIRSLRRVPEHDVAYPGGGNERLEPRRGSRPDGSCPAFDGDDDPQWRHAADPDGDGWDARGPRRGSGLDLSFSHDAGDAEEDRRGQRRQGRRTLPAPGTPEQTRGDAGHADGEPGAARHGPAPDEGRDDLGSGRFRQSAQSGRDGPFLRADADPGQAERRQNSEPGSDRDRQALERREGADRHSEPAAPRAGDAAHANEARQPDGRLEPGLRPEEVADHGRGDGRGDAVSDPDGDRQSDGPGDAEVGRRESTGGAAQEPWADWNGGLAHHLRVDDGLSAWVADTRIALGGPRGTAAAGLVVEAFGDAVVPQIPEAIGRAILRTEIALNSVYGAFTLTIADAHRDAEHDPSVEPPDGDDDGHGDAP